ncbi:MAG: hypothetical protein P8N56_06390 [Schleiferiaceae bacterium]|nr:hypothetical protein [Schleiferiaceae bacterium]
MKHALFLLPFALGALTNCEDTSVCDMSFHTVGFTWSDSSQIPDKVDVVVRETKDSLRSHFTGLPGYYPVVTDEHQSLFFNIDFIVDVYVYDSNDSLLTQNEWLITADRCHIQKVSGPDILP